MTWRTIDSAPKDGTAVLLYSPGYGRWIGSNDSEKPDRKIEMIWVNVSEPEVTMPVKRPTNIPPTHWQPLPAPPGTEGVSDE